MNLRKFALALFVLGPLGLSAQTDSPTSDLRVFTEEGQRFSLYLNGKLANEIPAAQVEVDGLPADFAHVRLVFQSGSPQLQRIITLTPGKRTLYMVMLTATGEPDLFFFSEENQTPTPQEPDPEMHPGMIPMTGPIEYQLTLPDTTGQGQPSPLPVYVNPHDITACLISPADFDGIYAQVSAVRMEMSKREMAWSAIQESCPMAEQVAQLVKLLAYSPDRLQLAIDAYAVVADKRNYYLVGQALGNPFDQQALREHIESAQGR